MLGPHAAAVARDDGTTDRQPHAQAAWFGTPERLEEPVHVVRVNAGASVAHRDQNVRADLSAADDDDTIPSQALAHCIKRVQKKVEDNLL